MRFLYAVVFFFCSFAPNIYRKINKLQTCEWVWMIEWVWVCWTKTGRITFMKYVRPMLNVILAHKWCFCNKTQTNIDIENKCVAEQSQRKRMCLSAYYRPACLPVPIHSPHRIDLLNLTFAHFKAVWSVNLHRFDFSQFKEINSIFCILLHAQKYSNLMKRQPMDDTYRMMIDWCQLPENRSAF